MIAKPTNMNSAADWAIYADSLERRLIRIYREAANEDRNAIDACNRICDLVKEVIVESDLA